MIKVKSIFDPVEPDDGVRIWVEPIGLTRDLREWCDVDYVFPQLGPPRHVWNDLQQHPDHYDHFSAKYRASLVQQPHRAMFVQLAALSLSSNVTLLHEGYDSDHNSAMALFELLSVWQE